MMDACPRHKARDEPNGAAMSRAAATRPSQVAAGQSPGGRRTPMSQATTLHGKASASVVVNRLGSAPVRLMPWSRWPIKNEQQISQIPGPKRQGDRTSGVVQGDFSVGGRYKLYPQTAEYITRTAPPARVQNPLLRDFQGIDCSP